MKKILGVLALFSSSAFAASDVGDLLAKQKGLQCQTRISTRFEGTELSSVSTVRIDSVDQAREMELVRSYPQRTLALGLVNIVESTTTVNFSRRRPKATVDVVFEAYNGGRDSIRLREKGKGKESETTKLLLGDGTSVDVTVELDCKYYRS